MKIDFIHKGVRYLLLLLALMTAPAFASEQEAFRPNEFIFGHISDAYSWHVTKIGKTEVSIPLLIIAKSQDRGWFVFSSAKFHHEEAAYQGFEIAHEGDFKGKLVETLPNGQQIRPLDLSITKNVASLLISAFLLLWIFLSLAKFYRRDPMKAPGGFQGAIEVIIVFMLDEVIKPGVGKGYAKYAPYLLTLFFFILINNMLGIIPIFPGGANLTGNIATTMVLAILSLLIINVFANKEYWKEIFLVPTMPKWMRFPIPLMPFLELVSVFTKPMALCIRLFANMLAGHMIAMVFMAMIFIFGAISPLLGAGVSILTLVFAIFMNLLELLVVFLQAYVFTMLTSFFIGMAHPEPHEAHAEVHH
ncbi:MAG TPA: F0F1 ATP synthase subunit A [Bacteroidales bacterium]|nr:F0F1 ATP synthase subunit A [Bacteroidales bacterium]